MPMPSQHSDRLTVPRRAAGPAAAAMTVALGAPQAALAAEGGLGAVAALTVGAVAVALGALAAALAYRLGLARRTAAATPPPAAAPAPDETAALALAEALHGPAVLLAAEADGWRWRAANAAARHSWPACGEQAWPAGLRERVLAAGDDAESAWRLLRGPGWMLAWQAAPAVPPAAEAGARSEAESFGFTLSHDLRAPLRVVEGFTRIVKEDYGPQLDRVGNDHLDRVLGAASRMNLMIDAMLALARLSQQPLARQPVDLSQMAGFVIDELRRGAPERDVEVEIEPGLRAQGDPTLLRLVLDNLLGNAWKYTAKAAQPRIELRREATVDAPGLGFVVRDNGAGFDMRSADRLFGLFQRLHSASDFPGHGVGLASVRRIVERHDGRVWADSEPGRGASFHVVLGAG
ncbi:MAG: ATP-binding protein [Burkholderiaceae bacterium]|nr:ATP-binding protein [Burkholderiaceae bacterium]